MVIPATAKRDHSRSKKRGSVIFPGVDALSTGSGSPLMTSETPPPVSPKSPLMPSVLASPRSQRKHAIHSAAGENFLDVYIWERNKPDTRPDAIADVCESWLVVWWEF
eukprot:GABV01012659.1.p2 GENE.GABV01012659.1~~GABV01012659.1.p2  ORF type:complete len:108 (+),score=29.74 GABV01012659.1:45-368(+)